MNEFRTYPQIASPRLLLAGAPPVQKRWSPDHHHRLLDLQHLISSTTAHPWTLEIHLDLISPSSPVSIPPIDPPILLELCIDKPRARFLPSQCSSLYCWCWPAYCPPSSVSSSTSRHIKGMNHTIKSDAYGISSRYDHPSPASTFLPLFVQARISLPPNATVAWPLT